MNSYLNIQLIYYRLLFNSFDTANNYAGDRIIMGKSGESIRV